MHLICGNQLISLISVRMLGQLMHANDRFVSDRVRLQFVSDRVQLTIDKRKHALSTYKHFINQCIRITHIQQHKPSISHRCLMCAGTMSIVRIRTLPSTIFTAVNALHSRTQTKDGRNDVRVGGSARGIHSIVCCAMRCVDACCAYPCYRIRLRLLPSRWDALRRQWCQTRSVHVCGLD